MKLPEFKNWDAVRNPADCPHCQGSGRAPSLDGRTPCGFCDSAVKRDERGHRFDVV